MTSSATAQIAAQRLVLASSSAYRKELLSRLQLPFEVAVPDIEARLNEAVGDGADVVWTHGSQFYEATAKVAEANPDVAFIGEAPAFLAMLEHVSRAAKLPTLTIICNNGRWQAVESATRVVYPDGAAAHAAATQLLFGTGASGIARSVARSAHLVADLLCQHYRGVPVVRTPWICRVARPLHAGGDPAARVVLARPRAGAHRHAHDLVDHLERLLAIGARDGAAELGALPDGPIRLSDAGRGEDGDRGEVAQDAQGGRGLQGVGQGG